MADNSNQGRSLSEARTDWAERRTALAAERTFAAWGRTALSCIGVGLAATRLFGDLEPRWLLRVLAVGLVGLGVLALAFGFRSYGKSARDLEQSGEHTVSLWWIGAFAVVLAGLGVAGVFLVW
ncbi:YidH family protein [Deinococcus sp. SM5_A1]|uniref:YidH family protein n=1 Tax=Deinococcus sp. SM5_A1 TaxID=3379094 RepID=UPI00385A78AF